MQSSDRSLPLHDTRVLCSVGFLAAASFVVMNVRIAMPGAPFLVYEPSDVAALVGAFTMGPAAGVAVVLLRDVLRLFVHPEVVGLGVNVIASGTYVAVAGWLYSRRRTRASAVLALVVATVVQSGIMFAVNLVLLPLYLGLTGAHLFAMLTTAILPFNLLKGAANAFLTYALYKRVSGYFPRTHSTARL